MIFYSECNNNFQELINVFQAHFYSSPRNYMKLEHIINISCSISYELSPSESCTQISPSQPQQQTARGLSAHQGCAITHLAHTYCAPCSLPAHTFMLPVTSHTILKGKASKGIPTPDEAIKAWQPTVAAPQQPIVIHSSIPVGGDIKAP